MVGSPRDHWPRHARQWARIGSPLRPAPEDVAICERHAASWTERAGRPPRALLLGVTPEIATMRWPAGSTLTAVDRSQPMIDAVFPSGAGTAICADWRAMPCAPASFDWIVGDGCATTLPYPVPYTALGAELRRVLAPGGELVLRLFALPEQPESLADVARALADGSIISFHALKWRIAMAVQPADRNVAVAAILDAFDRMVSDRAALVWSQETIATIDAYRGSELIYSFPTIAEATAALGDFVEVARSVPAYELGDRCPTLVFR